MKHVVIIGMSLIVFVTGSVQLYAQELPALEILHNVDAVANASKDQQMLSTMTLIDKDGGEKERKTHMYQKGDDMRLVRFLSPADQKGISFLSLPDDVMYLYLPAFRKIRMIASHVKNENFAGTDFSYDDMSAFNYAEKYDPTLLETTDEFFVLELTQKPGENKDYSILKMWVRQDNFCYAKIEYYDKGGNLWKILDRRNIVKKGDYWVAMEMEMKDLKKPHSTTMVVEEIEFDLGLSDKVFTKRNLKKVK